MADINDVLEKLVTDPGFRQQLREDLEQALEGYDLEGTEREMLAAQISEGEGGARGVEQRTSKSALGGLLAGALGGGGGQSAADDNSSCWIRVSQPSASDVDDPRLAAHQHEGSDADLFLEPDVVRGADAPSLEDLASGETSELDASRGVAGDSSGILPADEGRLGLNEIRFQDTKSDRPPFEVTELVSHTIGYEEGAGLRSDGELVQAVADAPTERQPLAGRIAPGEATDDSQPGADETVSVGAHQSGESDEPITGGIPNSEDTLASDDESLGAPMPQRSAAEDAYGERSASEPPVGAGEDVSPWTVTHADKGTSVEGSQEPASAVDASESGPLSADPSATTEDADDTQQGTVAIDADWNE